MYAGIDVSYVEVVPVDSAAERDFLLSVVFHGISHIVDFDLLDEEYVFVVRFVLFPFFADAEKSGKGLGVGSAVSVCRTVFENKVHLSIADEDFVHAEVLPKESFKCEFGNDVLGSEEGVHLGSCEAVAARMLVDDDDVLEDEGGERFEVHFLESYFSLDLFGDVSDDFLSDGCLHLRELYRNRYSEDECKDRNERQPEYFQRLFDNFQFLILQLAKIVKISDKIRIFAAGYVTYCMPFHLAPGVQ